MAKRDRPKFEVELDWYYISKESVRKWALVFVVAAGVIVWVINTFVTGGKDVSRRAAQEIASADELIAKCKVLPEAGRLKDEIEVANGKLSGARSALTDGRPADAISQAVDAQSIARQMLGGISTLRGDANIVDTGGRVEVQRANRATWENAKIGMKLFSGDFLKTGPTGLAEVMSSDGTLYRIKPETLFEVRRTSTVAGGAPGEERHRSEVKLVVGVIDTNTGEGTRSIVRTDAATADIASKSNVAVDVDTSKTTGVSTFRGSAIVSTDKGEQVTLAERERAVASPRGGGLSTKVRLPDSPNPLAPENNFVFDLRSNDPVSIRWGPIKDVSRYRLQIARSRLFIPDSIIVDLPDRTKTEAIVTVTEEGSFFWRVSALGKGNLASDWSQPRRFKVVAGSAGSGTDKRPPDLTLDRSKVIGNLVMVSGKTEPGATVTVNSEPADLDPSGAFRKMISLTKDGFNTIVVRATDGAGNETVRQENVLIQTN